MQHTIFRPLSSLRRYISFGELPSGHGQISVPRRTRCWICSTWWGLNDFIVSHVQSPSTHKTQTRHDLICAPAWVLALNKNVIFELYQENTYPHTGQRGPIFCIWTFDPSPGIVFPLGLARFFAATYFFGIGPAEMLVFRGFIFILKSFDSWIFWI